MKFIFQNLRDTLNLSKNEAKVYQALLEGASVDPTQIASITHLSRSRIYEVLSSLAAKNLLYKKTNSSEYKMIPPSTSISTFMENVEKEYSQKKMKTLELGSYLHQVWDSNLGGTISPGVKLLSINDADPMFQEHLKMVKNRVLIAAGNRNPTIDMRQSGSVLASIYHDNLDVRYLVPNKKFANKLFIAFDHFSPFKDLKISIKYNSELFSSFVILDDIIYVFFFGSSDTLQATAMRTSSAQLVRTFEWVFEKLWKECDN